MRRGSNWRLSGPCAAWRLVIASRHGWLPGSAILCDASSVFHGDRNAAHVKVVVSDRADHVQAGRRLVMNAILNAVFCSLAFGALAQQSDLGNLLSRGDARRQEYVEAFKNLIAVETRLTEIIDRNGGVEKERVVVSDFLVYRSGLRDDLVSDYASRVRWTAGRSALPRKTQSGSSRSWRARRRWHRNPSGSSRTILSMGCDTSCGARRFTLSGCSSGKSGSAWSSPLPDAKAWRGVTRSSSITG